MFVYQTEKRLKYYDQVVEIFQRTGYSAYRIAKLGLVPVERKAIAKWISNFVAENGKVSPSTIMEKTESNDELEALKARIADLEEQLRLEKMRGRLNDKIIEIAEKKYNIQIRKKAGAKQ